MFDLESLSSSKELTSELAFQAAASSSELKRLFLRIGEIAAPEDRDRVSAKGYTYGYIGSVLLQLICFVLVMKHDMFGFTEGNGSRFSFLLVGLWWWGFGHFALQFECRLGGLYRARELDQHRRRP